MEPLRPIWALMTSVVLSLAASPEVDFSEIINAVNSGGAKWIAALPTATATSILGQFCSWKSPPMPTTYKSIDIEIPETFDSRKQWPFCPTINQISNQGKCGSCWAVAAASALSDRFCIASNGSFVLPLSGEDLLTCCKSCGNGCQGGEHNKAWKYFTTNGIVTGGEYGSQIGCRTYRTPPCAWYENSSSTLPFCDREVVPPTPMCHQECTNPSYNVSYSSDHRKTKNWYHLPNNVSQIQREILTHGPVEASITVYMDFITYRSGIYHHTTDKVKSQHAVKIVGWGEEEGAPFWIIANSFGYEWGEGGFFRILRGTNESGIEQDVTGGVPLLTSL